MSDGWLAGIATTAIGGIVVEIAWLFLKPWVTRWTPAPKPSDRGEPTVPAWTYREVHTTWLYVVRRRRRRR